MSSTTTKRTRIREAMDRVPEVEKRLRETVTKLKKTIANQKAEIEELRQLVTRLTLACRMWGGCRGSRRRRSRRRPAGTDTRG
jgi:predicted RNase H-like nuclease (RuvC/YqgF family)